MGRSVVTIHAVHKINGQLLQFLVRNFSLFVFINDDGATTEYDLDPRNVLKAWIRGPKVYLVADGHVPMDSGILSEIRSSASGSHQKTDLLRGVLFVVAEIGVLHQLGSIKLFRPMTLFAGFPCRTQILKRHGNRS